MTKTLEKARNNALELRDYLNGLAPRMKEVLPKHLTAERMIRIALSEAARIPDLRLCSLESFASCMMTCSQLGLEPSSQLGHAYLIPRGSKHSNGKNCTLLIGYKGMLELVRRAGVDRIHAETFYQIELDNGWIEIGREPPKVVHQWRQFERKDDDIAGAYMVVEKGYARYLEICDRHEIEQRRSRSDARNNGPWKSDYERMARKCVIRKAFGGGAIPIDASTPEERQAVANLHLAMSADADSGKLSRADEPMALPERTLDALAERLESEEQTQDARELGQEG